MRHSRPHTQILVIETSTGVVHQLQVICELLVIPESVRGSYAPARVKRLVRARHWSSPMWVDLRAEQAWPTAFIPAAQRPLWLRPPLPQTRGGVVGTPPSTRAYASYRLRRALCSRCGGCWEQGADSAHTWPGQRKRPWVCLLYRRLPPRPCFPYSSLRYS